jgi:hypothetical protein
MGLGIKAQDWLALSAVAGMLCVASAPAQPRQGALERAGSIASQPARDLDAGRTKVPPLLQQAIANPYSTAGTGSCARVAASIRALNGVLGPDFGVGSAANEGRASRIAEAGGRSVVNSLVPFRGLVREVSGAAPAQRRLNAAMDAGYARRGFLRGLARARGCKG